jgi:hypothetical protein
MYYACNVPFRFNDAGRVADPPADETGENQVESGMSSAVGSSPNLFFGSVLIMDGSCLKGTTA